MNSNFNKINNKKNNIFAILFFISFSLIIESTSLYAEIVTQGIGSIEIKPDVAAFDITIETRDPNSELAAERNREQAKKTIKLLKQLLKPGETISTLKYEMLPLFSSKVSTKSSMSGSSSYDKTRVDEARNLSGLTEKTSKTSKNESLSGEGFAYQDTREELTGFKIINVISVEYLDLTNVGQLIDKIIKSGASRVDNLRFINKNIESSYQAALGKAIVNARQRADMIAKSGNLTITGVKVVIAEPDTTLTKDKNMEFASSARSPGKSRTPIEVNSFVVQAKVEVVFHTQKLIASNEESS